MWVCEDSVNPTRAGAPHLFNETQRPEQKPRWWLSTLGLMDPQVPSHAGIVTLRGQTGTPVVVLTTGSVLFMAPLAPGEAGDAPSRSKYPWPVLAALPEPSCRVRACLHMEQLSVSAQAPESLRTPSTAEAQALDRSPCLEQSLGWGNGT